MQLWEPLVLDVFRNLLKLQDKRLPSGDARFVRARGLEACVHSGCADGPDDS